jgi:hypothetical protein
MRQAYALAQFGVACRSGVSARVRLTHLCGWYGYLQYKRGRRQILVICPRPLFYPQ